MFTQSQVDFMRTLATLLADPEGTSKWLSELAGASDRASEIEAAAARRVEEADKREAAASKTIAAASKASAELKAAADGLQVAKDQLARSRDELASERTILNEQKAEFELQKQRAVAKVLADRNEMAVQFTEIEARERSLDDRAAQLVVDQQALQAEREAFEQQQAEAAARRQRFIEEAKSL